MNFKSLFSWPQHQVSQQSWWPGFLVSFLIGAISGGVFGVIGAVLLLNTASFSYAPGDFNMMRRGNFGASLGTSDQTTVSVVKKAAPAVVSIVITKDVPQMPQQPFMMNPFGNGLFDQFFGFPQNQPQNPRGTTRQQIGGGSGFFVSSDGLIVTNRHVVEDSSADYTVFTNDGNKYEATVMARDEVTDLALLKIKGQGFTTLPLGDSSNLALGQSVIAIGNALGEFRNTVSTGVISGLARSVTAGGSLSGPEQLTGVIQTDAAINPGNSGGPLLNTRGEVIGLNTAVAQGAENIGFAIPINDVKSVIKTVQETGKIVRPFLGVRYMIINEDIAKAESLPVTYGALIIRGQNQSEVAVVPGSPADKAGLSENDIILEAEGQKITIDNPLNKIVANKAVGDTVRLKIMHRGDTKDISVQLTARP